MVKPFLSAVRSSDARRVEPSGPVPRSNKSNGQALVEFTLVLPIIAFILLGVLDMSRVFTSQLAVESAAREAADFGAFNSDRWLGSPANVASNHYRTLQAMEERACVASSSLTNYEHNGTTCTNPSVAISLVNKNGSPANNCSDSNRNPGPCWVRVDMDYTFDLIIPFGIDYFGTRLGLPDQLTFSRSSIFAVSDFSVDTP